MKLTYFVSHPIQYQAPLLRQIAALEDIELKVVFEHEGSAGQAQFDEGFKTSVAWDIPLLEGYDWEVSDDLARHILDADVIWMHGWEGKRMRKVLELARREKRPVLMRGENTLKAMPDGDGLRGWCKKRYLDWIFHRCAAFLCIGTDNRDYYRAHGIDEHRLFSMPYAVDNDFFRKACARAAENRNAFRDSLGLKPDVPVILYAGKFMPRKNPHVLLDAFKQMESPAQLVFVGSGEMEDSLKSMAKNVNNVIFSGFRNQSELPAFYDLADIFVLASHAEPWGLAVNEAMNAGCVPVVTQECGCAVDLVSAETGAIVTAGDVHGLTETLERLVKDKGELAQLQENARTKISGWGFDEDIAGLREALGGWLETSRLSSKVDPGINPG